MARKIGSRLRLRLRFPGSHISHSLGITSVNQNFQTNRFIIAVLLLTYAANSEKEYKLVRARLLLVSPVSSEFIFLGWSTPHVINTILGHYAHFWIFWREFFVARKKRLAARGSRLGLAGSQNSLPHNTTVCRKPQRLAIKNISHIPFRNQTERSTIC